MVEMARLARGIIIYRKAPETEYRDASQGGQVQSRSMRIKQCRAMLYESVLNSCAQPARRTTRQLNVRQEWNTMTL